MTEHKVTIAIPTYNRSRLLKICLQSALMQDYPDYRILVLDNASTDDTEQAVRSFTDSRVSYIRNESNIGFFRNANRAIEINTSPYLLVLQDDDVILPNFVRESVLALEKYPRAAFSSTANGFIDAEGRPVPVKAADVSDPIPEGIMSGLDFLHGIVAGHKWILQTSAVMMRSEALEVTGPFDMPHSKDTCDTYLYYRLAGKFDVVFISKELCQIRYHAGRESYIDFDSKLPTGRVAVLAERIDAISYLMQSARASESSYRTWLAERLLDLSLRRSQETSLLVPGMTVTLNELQEITRREIEAVIPAGNRFILVDANGLGSEFTVGRCAIPFLERDGSYWGSPPDDKIAIQEFDRLRQTGASFIVFGWPAFWWLDYYVGWRTYLHSKFPCVLKNSRLVVFDLRE